YDEVIKLYRKLLENPGSSAYDKAAVQNNLAFILAITHERPEDVAESLKLINEAITVRGPTSDLLDTRALAYLAQNKPKEALADLTLAAADSPSITKYYHLAQAEKLNNNLEAAREAMQKAAALKVDPKQLTPIERKGYQTLADELK